MKYIFLCLICFSLLPQAYGKSNKDSKKIALYIQTWGFLKYNHTGVAQGSIDWDSMFITQIRQVKESSRKSEFNLVMMSLLETAGDHRNLIAAELPGDFDYRNLPNIKWAVDSDLFDQPVKDKIKSIYDHRNQGSNRFIKPDYEKLDFSIENEFQDIKDPTLEFRLLFLARYWNIINYLAPYKYLIPAWDNRLLEFSGKMIKVTDRMSYYKTLAELSKAVKDGHSQVSLSTGDFENELFGNYKPPFYCTILDRKVLVRLVAEKTINSETDIQQGDEILKVDGQRVRRLIAAKRRYVSASNTSTEMHHLSRRLLDGHSQQVSLKIKRHDLIRTVRVARSNPQSPNWGQIFDYTGTAKGYQVVRDSILIVYAANIWDGNVDTIRKIARQSKAVIFDVRNYPQNSVFYSVVDLFLSEPKFIDYSTVLSKTYAGVFEWKLNPNKVGHFNSTPLGAKVFILCDERTQSQGEYSCMVIQTIPNSITIGRQTAGADGKQTSVPMGGGITLSFSGNGIYYPDKRPTQQVGVRVDKVVKRTRKSIENGTDEVLEAALLSLD